MPKLFISHATAEDAHANRLARILKAGGIETWIDHDHGLIPGQPNWDDALRAAITTCDAGVLLMSPRSLGSAICAAECDLVRALGKPLYVAYLEEAAPEQIWLTVRMIQYARLYHDFDGEAQRLAEAILGTAASAHGAPTASPARITGADVMIQFLPYLYSVPLTGRDADVSALTAMLAAPGVVQLLAVGGTANRASPARLPRSIQRARSGIGAASSPLPTR